MRQRRDGQGRGWKEGRQALLEYWNRDHGTFAGIA